MHGPLINWADNSVSNWSPFCYAHCLVSVSSETKEKKQEEEIDLSRVPVMNHDLRVVFSGSQTASLPPNRSYDCSIDLLPGTSPPRGHLFFLPAPERAAMEKYLSESLAAGVICPSSSLASVGFICPSSSPASVGFVKKDGSLHPCIDY